MKVTLQVNGREMTFSKEELTAILEKHFASGTTKQEHEKVQVVQGPTEGEWFEVNPQAINQSLFQKKRKDQSQEETRQLILEAFAEVKSKPERYGKKFKTLIPKKTCGGKNVTEMNKWAQAIAKTKGRNFNKYLPFNFFVNFGINNQIWKNITL